LAAEGKHHGDNPGRTGAKTRSCPRTEERSMRMTTGILLAAIVTAFALAAAASGATRKTRMDA